MARNAFRDECGVKFGKLNTVFTVISAWALIKIFRSQGGCLLERGA